MSGPAELKRVKALHQKKYRDELGLFLVQGRKLVGELLRTPLALDSLYATASAARSLGLAQARILADHELERIGTLETGNEVVAVVRRPAPVAMEAPQDEGLVIALDGINDPGNLGTVLRIADWFGASAVWCAEGSVDAFNPKCVQASMGSLFRMPVALGPLADALDRAHVGGTAIYKAEASGRSVFEVDLRRPAILVLGSESHGLSAAVGQGPGTAIGIPAFGGAESLNVATAASALCMEFARRKLFP